MGRSTTQLMSNSFLRASPMQLVYRYRSLVLANINRRFCTLQHNYLKCNWLKFNVDGRSLIVGGRSISVNRFSGTPTYPEVAPYLILIGRKHHRYNDPTIDRYVIPFLLVYLTFARCEK